MSIAELIPESSPSNHRPMFDNRPTVLIAEDQPKMREHLVEQFLELGINPTVVSNGTDAIRVAGQLHPDLLVLDGLLPEMHGFEIARFVRHLDSSYRPHIAIITGIYKGTRYLNEAKLNFGVDDYLVKPVSTEQLAEIVTRVKRAA